jgi:hypothetical protein
LTAISTWIDFSPTALTPAAFEKLAELAKTIDAGCRDLSVADRQIALERLRQRLMRQRDRWGNGKSGQRLTTAVHILLDLGKQGWAVKSSSSGVKIGRPHNPINAEDDRQRIRQQLCSERDEQLRQESVRAFIRSMEQKHVCGNKVVSICDLMRDGRQLAQRIGIAQAGLKGSNPETVIQPYLQFVDGEKRCDLTGFRLVDIWRYFRHTWTTSYKSIPGRSMMILVRDKAAPFHPVIGIAALSSATVGLRD